MLRERRRATGSSSTATARTCCWWPTCAKQRRMRDDGRAEALFGIDKLQRAALGHPGGHPRRLLGAHPDRAPRDQPALPRAAQRASRR
ncbi:MAG: hypothetical protein MZV64_44245 [Ignavibacteriales bacterium]|nr:hypothetical protein [Ignavibacteriales bacterium]